jgi:drug/metabolite transporter (DMT)-like permease
VVFFLATNRSFLPRSRASWRWLLPIGVLDTAANLSLSIGLMSSLTSIVSVMSSLYGVVTVILGYVIAGERVTRIQQVGIVVTFIGVALVSL